MTVGYTTYENKKKFKYNDILFVLKLIVKSINFMTH